MRQPLTAAIAWRYLLSKKSHGAVGTITTVSVCAMAVATAAIVCVLSVFNGFRQVIGEKLDTLSPDIMVTPVKGKVFGSATALTNRLAALPQVEYATPTLTDNALVICNGREMPVTLKGVVPGEYAKVTAAGKLIPKDYGEYFSAAAGSRPTEAVLSVGVAARLDAYPGDGAIVFAPKREGRVNLANPVSSFITDSIRVKGVYRSDQAEYDDDGVMMPLEQARRLFMYEDQASAVELKLRSGVDAESVRETIAGMLGADYVVKDRMRQQEMNFRMVSIEKWVSFLLLVFILLIAAFNIISSLSMLVLEKEDAIRTLAALGLSRRRIGEVFAWESIYVSAAGGIAGILLGVVLVLLQQHFGLIRIAAAAEAAIIRAYPVQLQGMDILVTLVPVLVLGLITAAITAAFARSKANMLK